MLFHIMGRQKKFGRFHVAEEEGKTTALIKPFLQPLGRLQNAKGKRNRRFRFPCEKAAGA